MLDATAVPGLTLTVVREFADLKRELGDLGATLWIAALPPRALQAARQLPRWDELEESGRLFPTAMGGGQGIAGPGDRGSHPRGVRTRHPRRA